MPRLTIEELSARKAAKAANGGSYYSDHKYLRDAPQYAPAAVLLPHEITELQSESDWADYRLRASIMWESIFARFGLQQGYELGETF